MVSATTSRRGNTPVHGATRFPFSTVTGLRAGVRKIPHSHTYTHLPVRVCEPDVETKSILLYKKINKSY